MVRLARIENGQVVNVEVWDEAPDDANLIATEIAGPGWAYVDGAFIAPEEPAPAAYKIYKTTVIGRMDDAELATFKAQLDAQPVRAQMMWSDCVQLDAADGFFQLLQAAMTATWGEARAAVLLAPEG